MRAAPDYERTILNHYNLATPFPTEWPAENDASDASDDERPPVSLTKANLTKKLLLARRSRYSVLDHNFDRRPSAVTLGDGRGAVDNVVQKDEADALGTADSIVQVLRQRGLAVDDDIKLRNRFLLSSTTFSPPLFLAQVHANASSTTLKKGLDNLSRSIDQKSASLKVLVESNFERFVRAKATIDMVYNEMRNQGDVGTPGSTHSRQASRSSVHIRNGSRLSERNSSGPLSPPIGNNKPLPSTKKRNALTKENDFGINGIRVPLTEAGVKAQEVWGPILGGRDREVSLKALLSTVECHSGVFELSANIMDCIKRRDHDNLVEEHNKARRYRDNAREMAKTATESGVILTDEQSREVIVVGQMWVDVDSQVERYKKELWKRLVGAQNESTNSAPEVLDASMRKEEYMDLIGILLELGVEDNPIWVWLLSRYDHLKNKITSTTERSRVEIEILRRRLASKGKPSRQTMAIYLRAPGQLHSHDKPSAMDTFEVIELWEHIQACLQTLLSSEDGILGEVIEFWNVAQSFIDGKTQGHLPVGADGQSKKHHKLSTDGVKDLQNGAIELVNLVRDSAFFIFAEGPPEDISLLISPATPMTPREMVSLRDPRFMLDSASLPPPSPKQGQSWEKFAFWPPYANCISGVHYLSKLLILVGNASSEMAVMKPVGQGTNTIDRLKTFVSGTRERCVTILCDTWSQNAEDCKLVEDWQRSSKRPDETNMPAYFMAFEQAVITGLQKVLYISEAKAKPGSEDMISPPPTKILQLVRSQFVGTLYKALSGMVENAEAGQKKDEADFSDSVGTGSSGTQFEAENMVIQTVDASNRNVRRLLTLSNLQTLRSETVPQLLAFFETAFSVKLTDESKTVRDVLSQIDARLFQSFTSSHVKTLGSMISAGIASAEWSPGTATPKDVRPYIYAILLHLVLVHAEVSTTASTLTPQVLAYLLEQASLQLLAAFQKRSAYSLNELMQATLDVEFLAMTMPLYITEKASDCHNQIYLQLDKATDDEARTKLQNELPDMRSALKVLREGTKTEFACFEKKKRRRAQGSESRSASAKDVPQISQD